MAGETPFPGEPPEELRFQSYWYAWYLKKDMTFTRIVVNFFAFAEGPMNLVFRAWDPAPEFDRLAQYQQGEEGVALKVSRDPVGIEQVTALREILEPLDHPQLMPVLAVFSLSDHRLCIEMPYLPKRQTLDERINTGRISPQLIRNVLTALTGEKGSNNGVMQYLDVNNLVHTDLKPANILVSETDEVIVADPDSIADKSGHNFIKTPHYLPPEIQGRNSWTLHSSLYVVGRIMEEMVAQLDLPAFAKGQAGAMLLAQAMADNPGDRLATLIEFRDKVLPLLN